MSINLVIIISIFSFILMIGGLLIYFAPKFLIRISEPLNKEFGSKKRSKNILPADEKVFMYRHIIGPILVLLGIILIYYAYTLI